MGEPPSEEWKEVLRPALFARRAVLPICQPLNPQAVLSLNKLYAREHELLKTAQDATLSRVFAEEEDEDLSRPLARKIGSNAKWEGDVTKAGHLALFRVAQDRLRDKVDRATFQSGQTQLLSTSQTPHRFPVFAEALLADFFSVCSTPDTAELWMLAEACEAPDVNDIQYWCKYE
ncbi:hypothetical protein EJ03DRAFT_334825 [Teratosphaeria nubilosa]|uniref:Uncharacterized protein n=1 Tax=Teratosphaeria nubilosa TaxID=161662 RepID=A0A6G1LF20_9PEZI|nr:hypothetical protein EJ03DRAFT_334825 [Teratosphaeria nubilosa]